MCNVTIRVSTRKNVLSCHYTVMKLNINTTAFYCDKPSSGFYCGMVNQQPTAYSSIIKQHFVRTGGFIVRLLSQSRMSL